MNKEEDEKAMQEAFDLVFERLLAEGRPTAVGLDKQRTIDISAAMSDKERIEIEARWRQSSMLIHWNELTARSSKTLNPFAEPPKIIRIPGGKLGDVLRVLITRRAYERLVAPVIADAQHEYVEAIRAGNEKHARWIALRLYLIVWYGLLYGLLAGAVRRFMGAGGGG